MVWAIILFFPVYSMYGIYEQIIMGNPIGGDKAISNDGLVYRFNWRWTNVLQHSINNTS